MSTEKRDPERELLKELIATVAEETDMELEDQVLMLMYLENSTEKLLKFNEWINRHLNDEGHIDTCAIKALSAATRIGRGMEPND